MLIHRNKKFGRKLGALSSAMIVFGVAVAAFAATLLMPSTVQTAGAANAMPGLTTSNVLAAADPGCQPLSTVASTIGPNGQAAYSSMPVMGDASALYSQCSGIICTGATYSGSNSCASYCPLYSLQIYGYGGGCPGPAATIYFAPNPTSVSCGGASNLEVVVLDGLGLRVLDGASVTFTTTLGLVSSSDGTETGLAYTSLTIPPKQSGQALITATSGSAKAQKLVSVTC